MAQKICTILFLITLSLVQSANGQHIKKGIRFSHPSGFYKTIFELTISVEDPKANLYYTIDGTDPLVSKTRSTQGNSALITIDPDLEEVRPGTPAFLVRAIATISDTAVTEHVSSTYIFLEHVKQQSYPGYGWPAGSVNGQWIDLEVDQSVSVDPHYAALMESAMLDISSISVITDIENLFDSNKGIYVNAMNRGKNWERPCAIELINPDGSPGFFENAGLRIRGGWSRHDDFPKHAFRVFFREEYGTDKLRFPLFEDEGVSEFDKVDLRCAQNYSWSNHHGEHNTFVREVFSRDSQRDMGQPYTRSRYYHLYLNGMYWGLFQTQERAEARFAASYFGGSKLDYDVVKVNTDFYQYEIEATDGNLDAWKNIWDRCLAGFRSNKDYFRLMGQNSIGMPMHDAEVLVDIDNLIDYMLIIFYTGNFDSPVTQFRGNDFPNNVYAIYNREDNSKGFQFYAHDAEHSIMYSPITAGHGLNENRVNIGTTNGEERMEIREFKYFNPHWLHHKLTKNDEYKIRFADRAAKHLSHGGVLTPDKVLNRLNVRAKQIQMAIIGESARWGDTRSSYAFTRENTWIPELEKIRERFIPKRTDIVINQLKVAGLFSNLKSADLLVADSLFEEYEFTSVTPIDVQVSNPNSAGNIYYTLDGSDPRVVGGIISKEALQLGNMETLSFKGSGVLNVRILDGEEWSALRTLRLSSLQDDLLKLKITEIHYHPKEEVRNSDTLAGKDLEFIEFKNTSETALNLSGLRIDSAVSYTFPEKTLLPPGQFYVLASKPAAFYDYYALEASGNLKGNLSNNGEQIIVIDRNENVLIDLRYDDNDPWPDKADGDGPSLVSTHFNPTENPDNPDYWRISIYDGGTPFRDDELITSIDEDNVEFASVSIFPNPVLDQLHISIADVSPSASLDVSIYQLNGKLIWKEQIRNHSQLKISATEIGAGLKIIKVEQGDRLFTCKVLVNPE